MSGTVDFVQNQAVRLARKTEATYTISLLVLGLSIGAIDTFSAASIPLSDTILAGILIFGVLAVPRIRGVDNYIKLIAMIGTVSVAVMFAIANGEEDMLMTASIVTVGILFISTVIVFIVDNYGFYNTTV